MSIGNLIGSLLKDLDEVQTDLMPKQEIAGIMDPITGEVIYADSGWMDEIPRTTEYNPERDGSLGVEIIGTHKPDETEYGISPLGGFSDFLALLSEKYSPMVAAAKNKLSTPYWDKQNQIKKYLENDRRLQNKFGWGKTAQDDFSSGDVELAGLVGYEDWTGPREHGPFPAVKDWNINHKGLKRLQDEIRDMRRRGIYI